MFIIFSDSVTTNSGLNKQIWPVPIMFVFNELDSGFIGLGWSLLRGGCFQSHNWLPKKTQHIVTVYCLVIAKYFILQLKLLNVVIDNVSNHLML
jgi:hypothetical protein